MLSLSQNPADQYSKRNFHRRGKTDNNILKTDYSSLYSPYQCKPHLKNSPFILTFYGRSKGNDTFTYCIKSEGHLLVQRQG